jgi:hypothetical protein
VEAIVSELVPLLDEGADALESALLDAARGDAPPDALARQRTLAAVKVASAAALSAGVGVPAAKWMGVLGVNATKWIAIGSLASSVVLAGVLVVQQQSPAQVASTRNPADRATRTSAAGDSRSAAVRVGVASPASAVTTERASPPRAAPAQPSASAPGAGSAVRPAAEPGRRGGTSELTSAPPVAESGTGGSAAATAPAKGPEGLAAPVAAPEVLSGSAGATPLGQETALLQGVRESLATARVAEALTRLDDYDARFPRGVLREEAAVLRVQSLVAVGRSTEATELVTRFERDAPTSGYARRMRKLLGPTP